MRIMRIRILILLFIVFILIPKIGFSWWNEDWSQKKQIYIQEESGNKLINYPVNLTIDTKSLIFEGKVKEDCSDIRIIDEKTNKNVNFSILNCNSSKTSLIFRVNISSEEQKSDFYVYYSNPTSFSQNSSFNDIFYELWDDFSGENNQILNLNKWTVSCVIGNCSQVYCDIYSNYLRCFSRNDIFSGIYSNINFSFYEGWSVEVEMLRDGRNVYERFEFRNTTDVLVPLNNHWVPIKYTTLNAKGNWFYVKNLNFVKSLNNSTEIKIGNYTIENGWHKFKMVFNYPDYIQVYYDNELRGTTDYTNFGPSDFKILLSAGVNTQAGGTAYFDNVKIRKFTDPEPTIILDEEESYQPTNLNLGIFSQNYAFRDEISYFTIQAYYNNTPLTNIPKSDFNLFLDNTKSTIYNFVNYNNGTYLLSTKFQTNNLGTHDLKVNITYEEEKIQNQTQIIILNEPETKPLIITNTNWKNYISAISIKKPVLVYNTTREYIDYFISKYQPDEIYQLGTNLTFSESTFFIDNPETLIKIFFDQADIVAPPNKKIAISSSMLKLPILYQPSQKTIDYLKPNIIHNFTSVQQIENIFLQNSPDANYIILANPENNNSIFASSFALEKNAFVIQSSYGSSQVKNTLKQKIYGLNFQSSDYLFNQTSYLLLIGVPYFNVQDPVNEHINDYDGNTLKTDTPYADINDDGFLDFSLGRLEGTPEKISFQLEFSKIFEPDKKALMLTSYNTAGRYFDVMTPGGTMHEVIGIEMDLRRKEFQITRLTEKRLEFDEINLNLIGKLNSLADKIGILSEKTYASFFSKLVGGFSQLYLVLELGDTAMYTIYEFDWLSGWENIKDLQISSIKHLPLLSVENIIDNQPENPVLIYMSRGNETHWFIPENTTAFYTNYTVFDPSQLSLNPSFYYVFHSNSFDNYEKISSSLAFIGSTGNSHNLHSSSTAREFFKNFDKPVGHALTMAKNYNFELYDLFEKENIGNPEIYKKEYYTKNLIGDPSSVFDPYLDFKQSEQIVFDGNSFKASFSITPNYSLVVGNGNSSLYFKNPDSFVITNNKPIIPVYKKSFTLPSDTEIIDVDVNIKSQKNFQNITIPISIPDLEFFNIDDFHGTFPDKFYWNGTFELLDKRKKFDLLFCPVIYYSNNTAIVFDKIEVSFTYQSPLEVVNISSENIVQGRDSKIYFDIYSTLSQNTNIIAKLIIQSDLQYDIEKELNIKHGLNQFSIDFKNTENIGEYSVSLILIYNDIIIGPKYTHFTVSKKSIFKPKDYVLPFIQKMFFGINTFLKQTTTIKEKYTIQSEGDKVILDYVSWNSSLHIEQTPEKTISVFETTDGKLTIEQKPGFVRYQLDSPNAQLIVIKDKGKITQQGKGDIGNLQLNEMIEKYKEKLEYLEIIT